MILRGKGSMIGRLALMPGLAAALVAGWCKLGSIADRQALKNASLTSVRQQALTMFPRGSRLDDAASHLADIGFACQPLSHYLPDTSAPALVCASDGRGFPDFPAVNLTVMSRNGLIADIEVWNVMAHADSDADDLDMTATGTIRGVSSENRDGDPSSVP